MHGLKVVGKYQVSPIPLRIELSAMRWNKTKRNEPKKLISVSNQTYEARKSSLGHFGGAHPYLWEIISNLACEFNNIESFLRCCCRVCEAFEIDNSNTLHTAQCIESQKRDDKNMKQTKMRQSTSSFYRTGQRLHQRIEILWFVRQTYDSSSTRKRLPLFQRWSSSWFLLAEYGQLENNWQGIHSWLARCSEMDIALKRQKMVLPKLVPCLQEWMWK